MKWFNTLVTVGIIGIILLVLIPLSTLILNFLFMLNVSLSLLIPVITMYIRETLEFSMLPSLLSITTSFRLRLNISSTRKILLDDGYTEQMVRTFGRFVIRGNAVIGLTISLIAVSAQFIVITKGSECVAGVAVRLTLDTMPGRQMAIDADLNSSLINRQQAKERRSKIQRGADLFGSMNGAAKFVKGGAIISITITLISFVGDLIVDIMNSQGTIQDIMQIYTTPTIGDSLVPQISALFISIATGVIVTRSVPENSLGGDLTNRFLAQPRVLMTADAVAAYLCLIPGSPVLRILVILSGLISGGYLLYKRQQSTTVGAVQEFMETEVAGEVSYYKNVKNVYDLLNIGQIEMEFGYSLIPLADESSGGSSVDRVVMFRKQMAPGTRFVASSIHIKDNGRLNPNQYSILLKGEEATRGDILTDHYLVLPPGTDADDVPGIDAIDPAFYIPAKWVGEDHRTQAELTGYTLIDPTPVVITHLSEVVKERLHELLNRQGASNLLETLKKVNNGIVEDTIPSAITVGRLQKTLASLLRGRIPIRDVEMIVETLDDYENQIKSMDILAGYMCQVLKQAISRRFSKVEQMRVISLDDKIEDIVMPSVEKMDTGSYLALEPMVIQGIISSTTSEINKIKDLVNIPVILTSPVVRIYFKKLADQFYPNTAVVSFSEIDNNIQIQALGNISLGQRWQDKGNSLCGWDRQTVRIWSGR